jgi:hypothetical protein
MRAGFDSLRAEWRSERLSNRSAASSAARSNRCANSVGEIAENRRHSQMLFESLQDEMRIIADGLAHIAARIDRL